MILTHDFPKRLRSQPVSERTRRVVGQSASFEEIGHVESLTREGGQWRIANGERKFGFRPWAYWAATLLLRRLFAIRLRALIAVPISSKLRAEDRNAQRRFLYEGIA
jgi:hypothetical protein